MGEAKLKAEILAAQGGAEIAQTAPETCGRCKYGLPSGQPDPMIRTCVGSPPVPYPSGQRLSNGMASEVMALSPNVHATRPACSLFRDKFAGLKGEEARGDFAPRESLKLS